MEAFQPVNLYLSFELISIITSRVIIYAQSCGKIVIVYGPYYMKSIGIFRYLLLYLSCVSFELPKIAINQ